jgi:branched-chain amino acid transport system permease protein
MSGRVLGAIFVTFLAFAALPFAQDALGFPVFYLVFLSTIWFWAAQSTSWNILSGYSGYFSFGQAALVGVGAYTTAVLVGRQEWDFFATLPVSAILSTALALGIGGLAFRLRSLRGEVFALLTLAVPFILASVARITPQIDGGQGIIVPAPDAAEMVGGFQAFVYLIGLVVAFGAIATAYAVQRSRSGWALAAIHDAEDVAEGLGVPTYRHKMLAIALSGLIGGVSGSVFALQIGFVTIESVFELTIPLFVIVMSVLGGRSHWLGPPLGAVVVVTLQDRLASSGFEGWSLVILGTLLAVLVVLAPDGLISRIRQRGPAVAVAFIVPLLALGVIGFGDGVIDWLAIAMIVAAVVAFVPLPRRRQRLVPREAGEHVPAIDRLPVIAAADATRAAADVAAPGRTASQSPASPVDRVIVACTDLTMHYGGVHALDGLTLEVREGELVGLVGPNGSGKSTLIGILAGRLRPTSGEVRVEGRSIAGLPPHAVAHLGIARTYQIPRPFESMTVRDNVATAILFGRDAATVSEARFAADEYLAFVGLERLASRHPTEINLHERQLLEMARAIATRPRVLLLDEALAGLNPAEIDQAVEVVRRIHASGVTIVIVEHLLRVVNRLASRIVVLDNGVLLAAGAPATVMNDPAVVRAYLGRLADA